MRMTRFDFTFAGTKLQALGSGALYWPDEQLLVISDLHLGKSERMARRTSQLLPPYESIETLSKLDDAIQQTRPAQVICLGDSFDDLHAGRSLPEDHITWLTRLMAGRLWIWIEGNHDPGPLEFGGTHNLKDESRLILPAFGTYTGGLRSSDDTLTALMSPEARAILTGSTLCEMPMPR